MHVKTEDAGRGRQKERGRVRVREGYGTKEGDGLRMCLKERMMIDDRIGSIQLCTCTWMTVIQGRTSN